MKILAFLLTLLFLNLEAKEVITHEWEIENTTYYASTKNENYIRFKTLSKNPLVLDKDITGYIKSFKIQASHDKDKPTEWFDIKIKFQSNKIDVNSRDFNLQLLQNYFKTKEMHLDIESKLINGKNSFNVILNDKKIIMKADIDQKKERLRINGKGKTALNLLGYQQLPSPYGPVRELIELDFKLELDLK